VVTKDSVTFLGRRGAWITLLVIVLIAVAIVLVPVWIIQPFRPQSARGLELSYALRRWAPLATIIVLAVSLLLVAWLWRRSERWWSKATLMALVVPMLASTWFARQNHFEWMFRPVVNAAYAKTSEAGFVADTDMVIAVESSGEAVAYPVRLMAYHHLVQDVVGGTPIVATY
jgi:hypothetical protein